jgi:hypothetical protein
MLNINSYNIEKINFNKKKTNYYIKYDKKPIEFYVNNTINITEITSYKNKSNIIIKIDEKTKEIIENIENKFINQYYIDKNDYIPIIKNNEKGNVIKLKIMNRYQKLLIDLYDINKEPIVVNDLEKFTKIKCLIHIGNFWNYNEKYGLLIYCKKINKLY